jgi:uncharacterized membrane protein YkoI
MTRGSSILIALILAAPPLGLISLSRGAETDPHDAHEIREVRVSPKPICLPQGETREEVKAKHLLEPFAVLKSAGAQFKGEPLSARLCHIGDEFVYEIALLHRDGRFVHVVMNAATGKVIERRAREPAPKN